MLSPISNFQKKIWDKWNIRVVILFSLFLQIFLIISAPSRKRTKGFIVSLVWLAYLFADMAAGYCIGLISNNQDQKSSLTQTDNLMAFWGPFLLLHLGGPDSISAFALEDNELWLRHLLGLVFQSLTAAYIFLLTLPHNTLLAPTILMFVAGLIKYAERTHALYVAAVDNFRKSLLPKPDAGPNYAKLMEEHFSSTHDAGLPAKIIMISELRQRSNNVEDVNKAQESNDVKPQESNKDIIELVQTAYFLFTKFQGLIVDMIFSFKDRLESREKFKNRTAEEALSLIEIELNFMYEVFYTKISVVRKYSIWFWGKLVSLIMIVATIVLFIKVERHHGNGFDKLDVKVTYALLFGALVLDVLALFKRFFTDHTATLCDESLVDSYSSSCLRGFQLKLFRYVNQRFLTKFLKRKEPTWSTIKEGPYEGYEKLSTNFWFRRWCGSISGHNLLKYCLDESIPRVPHIGDGSNCVLQGIQRLCFRMVVFVQDLFYLRDINSRFKDFIDQSRYESNNPFLKDLWVYIFGELKNKSSEDQGVDVIQSICSARGERAVQREKNLMPFVDPNEVVFDQTLLLWHIATSLCYSEDAKDVGENEDKRRKMSMWQFITTTLCQAKDEVGVKEKKDEIDKRMKISMLISDYMLYLLVMQPNMMSGIAGIGQIRFQDTCAEAKKFFKKRIISPQWDRETMLKNACKTLMKVPTSEKPIDVKGDRSKSLLFDACRLAKELNKLRVDKKWEIMCSVWVELLSYAASHCRPTGHVQLLSKGGEFISFVWLLMCHLGLSTQFQIKEGHARAKLIVGKLLK